MAAQQAGGFFASLGRFFGLGGRGEEELIEHRGAARIELRLPVRVRHGTGHDHPGQTRNISPIGLFLEVDGLLPCGALLTLFFEGIGQAPEIPLVVKVVRTESQPVKGLGVTIERAATGAEAWGRFRDLVNHYRHHPPLLQDQRSGFVEASCPGCSWVGRVGEKALRCPRCGQPVKRI
ncbi:MAG: PilZ domain-containing protein [Myxococcota bacterium]|nr:PilZ domain-containing protein [Myxococcota bacterium]